MCTEKLRFTEIVCNKLSTVCLSLALAKDWAGAVHGKIKYKQNFL